MHLPVFAAGASFFGLHLTFVDTVHKTKKTKTPRTNDRSCFTIKLLTFSTSYRVRTRIVAGCGGVVIDHDVLFVVGTVRLRHGQVCNAHHIYVERVVSYMKRARATHVYSFITHGCVLYAFLRTAAFQRKRDNFRFVGREKNGLNSIPERRFFTGTSFVSVFVIEKRGGRKTEKSHFTVQVYDGVLNFVYIYTFGAGLGTSERT